MALKQTNIPESALPSSLDPENELQVLYKTNILFPTLGPITAVRYVSWFARLLEDLAVATVIFDKIRTYRQRYNKLPKLPQRTFALNPYVVNPTNYLSSFVHPIRQLPWPKLGTQAASAAAARRVDANEGETVTSSAAMRRADDHEEETISIVASPDGQLDILDANFNLSPMSPSTREDLDAALILRALTVPNEVVEDLFDAGVLNREGNIVADLSVMEQRSLVRALTERLATRYGQNVDPTQIREAKALVRVALRTIDRATGLGMSRLYENNPDFQDQLTRYLLAKLTALERFVEEGGLQLPGDEGIDIAREWAFQRYEELRLELETPTLRGPVSAVPVTPQSRQVLTETETHTMQEDQAIFTAQAQRVIQTQAILTSTRFQGALDNLSEYGISDTNSFSQDRTLLATLQEERREVVDLVARETSSETELFSGTRTSGTTGWAREYTTEGKDPKLATTELGFHVIVPARATVRLKDLGLVWCPRVVSPFLKLHGNIADYEDEQKASYIAQHYVPLPVKPVIKVDVREEKFEVQINGRNSINLKEFTRTFEFTNRNSFIDLDGITAKHRNGGASDFNWRQRWNWDDLEHAVARVQNLRLSGDGKTLTGTAVLETHDPEYFNRSFVTITVPIKTYSDETVAALARYEQDLQEQDFKEEAVRSRAAQYARLKRDELIERYEGQIALRTEAFRALIQRIFIDTPVEQLSYFEEVISRCVDWPESNMVLESQPMNMLPYRHLAADHFMNCPAIRFFLPIRKATESLFFETIKAGGITYHQRSADIIRQHLKVNRDKIVDWTNNDPAKLVLDEFDTEITIGRHFEAVLSGFEFTS
jgi:hypothetical protein